MTRDVDEELIRRLMIPWRKREPSTTYQAIWGRNNREKTRAKTIAQRHGFEKKPCERCGSEYKVEKHHPEYSKPLLVIFLCRPCHKAEHTRLRKVNAR